MVVSRYNTSQIVARANSYATYATGMCLNFTWVCCDYPETNPHALPDANAAWYWASQKVYAGTPPAGAPVYWASGSHGHIAPSVGGGLVRSTDWPYKGRVGTVSISQITSAWGMSYRGWSRDYAGKPIAGLQLASAYPATKPVDLSSLIYAHNLRPGYSNNDAARFEKALWNRLGGPYRLRFQSQSAYVGDPYYGTLTQQMCSDAYAMFGLPRATYPGGTLLLQRLGFTQARV